MPGPDLSAAAWAYRYEPCGLVDIEFGWMGSLIIGHETGGLGKMPGFYFKSGVCGSARVLGVHALSQHASLANACLPACLQPPQLFPTSAPSWRLHLAPRSAHRWRGARS